MPRLALSFRLFTFITILLPIAAFAQTPARTHDIQADDYFSIGVIAGCALSPDGKQVAYIELRWDEELDGRNADIWVVDIASKERKRLTFDRGADTSPRWSPDGQFIYFLGAHKLAGEKAPPLDGKQQVWRIAPTGGDPFAVTRCKDGIGQFELSKSGRTLYYTVKDEQTEGEFAALRKRFKKLEYGHGVVEYTQIWKMDLESWRTEKVVDQKRVIHSFAVSPDETRIAMITTADDKPITNEGWSRVDVYDAAKKEVAILTPDDWRKDHPTPYGWVEAPTWSGDGQVLAFSVSYDGYPSELYVAESSGDKAAVRKLDRPDEVDLADGSRMRWRGDTRDLCFVGESHARKQVCAITDIRDGKQGQFRTLTPGDVVIDSFSFDRAGHVVAAVMSTLQHPPELYCAAVAAEPAGLQRLTNVNPQVDTWKLPQISLVTWPGANGDQVEGILELPPDYQPGKPLPMVFEIHGGPTSATPYCLQFWIYGRTLLPAKGYALLSPNYRGSTGYGRKFMTGLVGHENEIEVEDILKGVDAMVERGIADPAKLGVMGWSNGGFLTNCLITQTDRFKAASTGAGILDMVIQWGAEDTPGHVVNYMQGFPWQKPDAYRKASPVFALDKVRTPTLIHVGGADPRCPPAHSRGLYRALKYYLHVPTELVVYPGESHSLTKYKHRQAKMEWDLAWFEKYILGKEKKENGKQEASAKEAASE
jgi:dipeptidyl aminopeptidase/acylaminoacyl peptidase